MIRLSIKRRHLYVITNISSIFVCRSRTLPRRLHAPVRHLPSLCRWSGRRASLSDHLLPLPLLTSGLERGRERGREGRQSWRVPALAARQSLKLSQRVIVVKAQPKLSDRWNRHTLVRSNSGSSDGRKLARDAISSASASDTPDRNISRNTTDWRRRGVGI